MEEIKNFENKKKSTFREFIEALIIAVLIALPIKYFVAQPFIVIGSSMEPTFENGDYLIIDKVTYRFNNPERGDVIVLRPPFDKSNYFIKRIIGLPGETVIVEGDVIKVQKVGEKETIIINEPYVSSNKEFFSTTKLSDSEYFVMGDNRSVSSDSRVWGPLPKRDIAGRAVFRLLPFKSMSSFPGSINKYEK